MHTRLQLLNLQNRCDLHMTCACHKAIYFEGQSSLSNFYVPIVTVTGRNTRNADTVAMRVRNIKSKLGRHSISYRGPRFRNQLPSDVRVIHNYNEFLRIISSRITMLFVDHPT